MDKANTVPFGCFWLNYRLRSAWLGSRLVESRTWFSWPLALEDEMLQVYKKLMTIDI